MQRGKDNTTITLNLRRYKNASLFGHSICQKMNCQKPTDRKSIKFRILQLQNIYGIKFRAELFKAGLR